MMMQKTVTAIDLRVQQYTVVVKQVAHQLKNQLPETIQQDDLIQSGLVGLLEAMHRFDASKKVKFETYARIRIRGAMLDDLRKTSWVPRSAPHYLRLISKAEEACLQANNRAPQAGEVATKLGLNIDAYNKMLKVAFNHKVVNVDDKCISEQKSTDQDPAQLAEQNDLNQYLNKAVSQLSQREQMLLSLHYVQGLGFKVIAIVLGVSEARISQLHAQALVRLQHKIQISDCL